VPAHPTLTWKSNPEGGPQAVEKGRGRRAYHARGCGSGRDQYARVYRRFRDREDIGRCCSASAWNLPPC